jgi:hypothetical protein
MTYECGHVCCGTGQLSADLLYFEPDADTYRPDDDGHDDHGLHTPGPSDTSMLSRVSSSYSFANELRSPRQGLRMRYHARTAHAHVHHPPCPCWRAPRWRGDWEHALQRGGRTRQPCLVPPCARRGRGCLHGSLVVLACPSRCGCRGCVGVPAVCPRVQRGPEHPLRCASHPPAERQAVAAFLVDNGVPAPLPSAAMCAGAVLQRRPQHFFLV